ncbi:glucose-6-phosphate isomerase [Paeniglutamicibacter cryotolerans]|uniref:Glucose-6-phosphate isomerase n=1 Tax=Paeniglutamicibacter cryotolerans TaxID=670079 RepID=A0A839QM90_9MICC|nr:glucose-6-phosphate isomerase [Paeniglutamicibacter cryotolerans]MBB2996880.1 glucose-6-phosphate isomerase [Paeniglutamicibacter cryotolerans]
MSSLGFIATGAAQLAVETHVGALAAARVASRIAAKDLTLWGPDAEAEASVRLDWVDLAETSRALLAPIAALRAELRAEGINRIVLAGMGGSSLAPEVITATYDVELVVLDSTDPDMVANALTDRLATSVLVVASKSGSTVETDSQRRVFEQAFGDAGVDAKQRIIVITDPDSPLDLASQAAGYRAIFHANPKVGGRYSALTAFGLVPSGLAGVDIESLLEEAEEAAEFLADDDTDNIGLALGAALAGTVPLRDKIVFSDEGSGIVGFADWAEQLIAESTGKSGTGLLPVVVENNDPELAACSGQNDWDASDMLLVRLVADTADLDDEQVFENRDQVIVSGSLGSQMLLWEYATVVASRLLGINPFDQPDVESAKTATRGLLDATPAAVPAMLTDGAVEIRATDGLLDGVGDLEGALAALLETLEPRGYLSVQAYLDRMAESPLGSVRALLAEAARRPATFGWGPRFLHSTGQFHKGGPKVGAFLQITAESALDLSIPGIPFTFGELISAQATGDAQVLADLGRPVLRLHLTDRDAGMAQLAVVAARLTSNRK